MGEVDEKEGEETRGEREEGKLACRRASAILYANREE